MRTKVTLVLLFLNVVLFCYVFYYERPLRTEIAARELRRAVLPPEVAGMNAFTRTLADGTEVRAEKRGEGWWLTAPYDWPANPNAISRIHHELQFLRNETKFRVADLGATGLSLADYGLERPALTFTFQAGDRSFPLRLGDETKTGNRLYVLGPDDGYVHVVSRSLAESLGLPLAELRSESIFTIPVFEVRSLGVQTASLKTRLRRDAARWSFETPILARAHKASVEVTVNALNALRADRFFEPRDPAIGRADLDNPALRVTLEGNSRRETLLIGAPVPAAEGATAAPDRYFARIEDKEVVFSVALSAPLLETLRGAQETLRDTRVLDFDPRQVSSITLSAPGTADLSLQRLEAAGGETTEDWQLLARSADGQAPLTRPADAAIVRTLLENLQGLTAQRFVSDAPSAAVLEGLGFNRPERQVALAFSAASRAADPTGPTGVTLFVGTAPDRRDAAFARLGNAPYVYQVSPEILRQLPVSPLHYRQRVLRRLPAGARLTGLRLVATGREEPLYARQLAETETGWDAALATEPAERRAALAALLRGLQTLEARRFVSEAFDPAGPLVDGAVQPWAFRLEATLGLLGGANPAQSTASTLHLSPRLGGGLQLAGTDDFGGVTFELTQEMVDALFTLTYGSTRDPGPPPAEPPAPAASAATPAPPPNG